MLIRAFVPRTRVRRSLAHRPAARPLFDALSRGPGVDAASAGRRFVPRVDVSENADELRFTAELPGLDKNDFDVTVDADVITIKGAKKVARGDGEGPMRFARSERRSGEFARSFRIPFDVDPEAVAGRYRDGVLSVHVPKPAQPGTRERVIPITTR